ncbi:head GIN domain-containing protein [Winogradskyella sp. A3E31]|uniref:head GIN domain-containing protein n=1 Tax=Winogradskyella sp. A3E31 TaxID=3349637 RepID=UPI00398A76F8
MKQTLCLVVITLLLGCSGENVPDCFQTAGTIIQQEILVPDFDRILVNRDIELIIKQADDYAVVIETGENLLSDVKAEVIGNQLVLTDNNTCNYVRDFGITKVFVFAPNLTEIRTSTQYDISSDGVLNYPDLDLISEDFTEETEFTVGDFRLNVDSENLRIVSNNISFFYLSGRTRDLFVGFFAGTGRFEGENLIADNVSISHRGSNDMVVNPQLSLTGVLRGTGNLISKNQPPTVDIEELYTGRLIFD